MARPLTNKDLGVCPCPTCDNMAKVRRNAKRRLYLVCTYCNGAGLQEYILENSRLFGPTGAGPGHTARLTVAPTFQPVRFTP